MGHYDSCYEADAERQAKERRERNKKHLDHILKELAELRHATSLAPQTHGMEQAHVKLKEFEMWVKDSLS